MNEKIKLKDLVKALKKIVKYSKSIGIKEVSLKEDYYWYIESEEKYDVESNPKNLTLGQLHDEYTDINLINSGESEAITNNFSELGAILDYLGRRLLTLDVIVDELDELDEKINKSN